jgi:hypothetical protein
LRVFLVRSLDGAPWDWRLSSLPVAMLLPVLANFQFWPCDRSHTAAADCSIWLLFVQLFVEPCLFS